MACTLVTVAMPPVRVQTDRSVCVCVCVCVCNGPVSKRCRSSETNFRYGYRHKCIHVFCLFCFLTANKVVVFNRNLYWCNLLIHVVSMIIVRSV